MKAARDLVVRHGYDGVTTEMISKAAGVSKQTLYRRWSSKPDLILDAFLDHAQSAVDQFRPSPAPGNEAEQSIEIELELFLQRTFLALEETGSAIRSLMAAAQSDPQFRLTFRERFIKPRRQALKRVLEHAVERGELASDADLEAAVISLFGAVWYRLLLDEPFDKHFGKRLAKVVLNGLQNPGTRGPSLSRGASRDQSV